MFSKPLPHPQKQPISIKYCKRKNTALFKNLEVLGLQDVQNYTPVNDIFFKLNDTNRETTTLCQVDYLTNVKKPHSLDMFTSNIICEGVVVDKDNRTRACPIFIKFIPLVDTVKFVSGHYARGKEHSDKPLIALPPSFSIHPKLLTSNNAAYVDSLFVYLSSLVLSQYQFIHGLYYYGSFLAIKKDFTFDVLDDLDEVTESTYFQSHKNKSFFIEDYSEYINSCNNSCTSNNERPTIQLLNDACGDITDVIDLELEPELENFETDAGGIGVASIEECDIELNKNIDEKACVLTKSEEDCEDDNSDESLTDDEWESGSEDSGFGSNESSSVLSKESVSDSDSETDEGIKITIPAIPVNAVCMERCDGTFEEFMASEENANKEWISALFQMIMTLLAYQKLFALTHNDLHIGNVMYVSTPHPFLYYKYKDIFYKVPTYGRIFKIIDFGRSIYTIQGHRFCSDEFALDSNAYGQYNTEPNYNSGKPRIEPNNSFDLCRFACSVFECMVDDLSEIPEIIKELPAFSIIADWCKDDKKNNICLKRTGRVRYPGFKLYKMIARLVHQHTPENQMDRPEFKQFRVKKVAITNKIMDLDSFVAQ